MGVGGAILSAILVLLVCWRFYLLRGFDAVNTPLLRPAPGSEFCGNQALLHVEIQAAFGPRPTGSDASRRAGNYILSQLEALGWQTETQPFVYRGIEGQNLLGRKGKVSHPVLILGAHYDTRSVADQDLTAPDQPGLGANDGASGVAILLELARVLDLSAVDGEVWLAFFDAEDNGHIHGWEWVVGSTIFVEQLKITPAYVIVVDMVGDIDQVLYFEANSDPSLSLLLWRIAADLGYGEYFVPQVGYSVLDDHIPFLRAGIPAVDVIDFDYPFWHTTQDTIDKVSTASLERVGRTLEIFLESGGRYPGSP